MGIAACETDNDFFSASDLFETMIRIQFLGLTGNVDFNKTTGTRHLEDVRYTIQNLLSSPDPESDDSILLQSIKSAVVDSSHQVEVITPFVYADNTTNQPRSLPPQQHNPHLIPTWALALGLSICGATIFMSIGWGVWSIVNRKHRMVRASQPFFLIMLCVGTFLIACSIIPTSFQEPMSNLMLDVGCMLFPWLVSMVLCLYPA